MPTGGTQVIEPAALIARLDALGRHGAGHFTLSPVGDTLAGGEIKLTAGHVFDGGMPGVVQAFHGES